MRFDDKIFNERREFRCELHIRTSVQTNKRNENKFPQNIYVHSSISFLVFNFSYYLKIPNENIRFQNVITINMNVKIQ